jgi:hypothetical protein
MNASAACRDHLEGSETECKRSAHHTIFQGLDVEPGVSLPLRGRTTRPGFLDGCRHTLDKLVHGKLLCGVAAFVVDSYGFAGCESGISWIIHQ